VAGRPRPRTVTVGGETITVSVPTDQTVTVTPEAAGTLPQAPTGVAFPLGALGIDVQHVTPGAITHVTIALQHPVHLVRKLIAGVWDRFLPDGTTGASVSADGLTISLDLQDGGRGDSDGAANGTIVDPVAPADATVLTVTTDETPLMTLGQPYSLQLGVAGATGAVTWSVGGYDNRFGTLPAGISLDPATGILSGTPTVGAGIFQVVATDQVGTAGKLVALDVAASRPAGTTSTGALLPGGGTVAFGVSHVGNNRPDLDRPVRRRRNDLDSQLDLGPCIRRVLLPVDPPHDPHRDPDRPGRRPERHRTITVRDADSGAVLATPVPFASFGPLDEASFSPDGTHLQVHSLSEGEVFDTTTWAMTMAYPCCGSSYRAIWSPTNPEFVISKPVGPGPSDFSWSRRPGRPSARLRLRTARRCSTGR